jgi:hypothetical protein
MPEMIVLTESRSNEVAVIANEKLALGGSLTGIEQVCLIHKREKDGLRWFTTKSGKELFSTKGESRHGATRFLVSDGPPLIVWSVFFPAPKTIEEYQKQHKENPCEQTFREWEDSDRAPVPAKIPAGARVLHLETASAYLDTLQDQVPVN